MDRVSSLILAGALGNALLAATTYLYYGWNAIGTAVAARSTARFSALLFAMALMVRWDGIAALRGRYREAFWGFVVAHYVHFATVIALRAAVGTLSVKFLGIAIASGFALVTAAALTMRPAPRVHLALSYAIWAAFVVSLGSRAIKHALPEGPFVLVVIAALVIHVITARRHPAMHHAHA